MLLTLRIGKAVEARTGDGWMLDYYGPPEWKELVDAEEPQLGAALLDASRTAQETLPRQNFEAHRTRYLTKHLEALRTVARRLAGERLSLEEQAAGCFDLNVGWVAEEASEEAEDLSDRALPGWGGVRERLIGWKTRHELPRGKADLSPPLFERATLEAGAAPTTSSDCPRGKKLPSAP